MKTKLIFLSVYWPLNQGMWNDLLAYMPYVFLGVLAYTFQSMVHIRNLFAEPCSNI